jgi:hypothetical protein
VKDITGIFKKERETNLGEYHAVGTLYSHPGTGCSIFHISCDDPENLFAFTFPTPPKDSSGVTHIIEHSVLSGSSRFPVKDPFAQLMKGSMHTFLNAMTYPDKTIYPASSKVEKDFFNLLEVYGDAVFFPLLREEIFLQEGHRLHLRDSEIFHTGVVYNEMMGNYANMESITAEWSTRSLFEKTPYRYDSGGEPYAIAGLSYEDFKGFYQQFYHPSNCLVFLYGNIPAEKTLQFLDRNILSKFSGGEPSPPLPDEPRWKTPKRMTVSAPASENHPKEKAATALVNWLTTASVTDPVQTLYFEVLGEILLGNPGAPLYQRLIESGVGQDISPVSGVETHVKQIAFSAGLRGISPEDRDRFEQVLFSALGELAEEGIPENVIEGSLNRVEFRNRERRGGIPFGLRLLSRCLRGWLYGAPPEATLRFSPWIEQVRTEYAEDRSIFSSLVRKELLDNPHRSSVLVRPDPEYTTEVRPIPQDDEEVRRRSKRETELFLSFQKKPDPPEALDTIPSLVKQDIPREVEIIQTEPVQTTDGFDAYRHVLPTNGVVYLDLAFPADHLTSEELHLLPLFGTALYKIGCDGYTYDQLSRTLYGTTGGFQPFLETSTVGSTAKIYLFLRMKVLEHRFAEGIDLAGRILRSADFSNVQKIQDVLRQMKNQFAASVIPRGNQYAMLAAARKLQPALRVEETWKGISQLLFLHACMERGLENLSWLEERLFTLGKKLFTGAGFTFNITAEEKFVDRAFEEMKTLSSSLSGGTETGTAHASAPIPFPVPRLPDSSGSSLEGFAIPGSVGFAGFACRGSLLGSREHALEALLTHYAKTGLLWERIRMQGGAYGVSASSNGTEGIVTFTTYRDPNSGEAFDVWEEVLEEIISKGIDKKSLEKSLIGVVGKDSMPLAPGTKGFVGFRRRLYAIRDEDRQAKRDRMIGAATKDIAETAARLRGELDRGYRVILAGSSYLKELEQGAQVTALPI